MDKKEQHTQQQRQSRRNFLRGAAAAPVAAAVAATPLVAQAEVAAPVSSDSSYRVTQHVLDYYKSLR
jgi:nitrous oxide reductase